MAISKLQILENILGSCKKQGNEYLFYCPICVHHHKPKLSISIDKNKYKCWLGCELVGNNLINLVYRFGNKSSIEEWKQFKDSIKLEEIDDILVNTHHDQEKPIFLPESFKTLCSKKIKPEFIQPIEYLISRGLDEKDIYKWKIGFCDYGDYRNRVIFPSFSEDAKLNYFVGRDYTGYSSLSYFNSKTSKNIIFNELSINWLKPITLTEGVFDAVKVDNSIPLLGKTLLSSSKLIYKIVENKTPVYMGLDLDAEESSKKIIKKLIDYNVKVYKIDLYPYKDLGEMSKEEIKIRKNNANLIDDRAKYLEFLISQL